jgi:alkylation response protein AidB-like acyl-CoA dehydrogenase
VDFALSEEQATLQDVLRDFFDAKSSEPAVREQMTHPSGYDQALWRQMAEQLGLQSLAIPEEYGGSGFSFVELGLTLEEMGRALVVSPFFASCVMAAQLLLICDDVDANKEYLPGIASGELIATVAIAEDSGSWLTADVTTMATETNGKWTISGHKSFVLDGAVADLLLVAARTGDGVGVFAVDASGAGLTRVPLQTMDQTRKQARIEFDATPARLIGELDGGTRAIETMLDHAMIALSSESLGGTARVLDMAVEYAKVREQFGRPIGSFQAIKHKCASMLVELESSRSAAYYALWAVSADNHEVPKLASLTKAFCADTYLYACGENIQILGGIGFTWEHPAHLYLKRAKNAQLFLGSSDFHRQRLADLIGI